VISGLQVVKIRRVIQPTRANKRQKVVQRRYYDASGVIRTAWQSPSYESTRLRRYYLQ